MLEKVIEVAKLPEKNMETAPMLKGSSVELNPDIDTKGPILEQQLKYKYLPRENVTWEGAEGDSKCIPEDDFVPLKSNPDEKNWGEIKQEYNFDGIEFKDGNPDFTPVSKETVEIDGFSSSRSDNFDKADRALAEQRGCEPGEVRDWRKENCYTWHECKDMKTMNLVPGIVHNNIPHMGGISEAKKEGL